MVSQTTYLFDESIEDNLRIAKPDATQEEIERACKMASVHDFIMSLPEGYKTQVGAMGDNLSAGEKQRIGLATGILKGQRTYLARRADEQRRFDQRGHDLKVARRTEEQKEHYFGIAQGVHNGDSGQNLQSRKRRYDGGTVT